MPWHIESDNPECDGWAVVKDDDDTIEGCHATEDAAQAQVAALYASEEEAAAAAQEPAEDQDEEAVLVAAGALEEHADALLRGRTERETRNTQRLEVRRSQDGAEVIVGGYASVFDSPYTVTDHLGEYQETVRSGAFARSIKQQDDVRFYVNHEGMALARSSAGNLDVAEDDTGLAYEARLDARVSYVRDLEALMETGVMRESSFAFAPKKQAWNADYTERELIEVQLFDVSVVSLPANPAASAGLRALEVLLAEARQGKVLSTKNEGLIRDVVEQLSTLLESLTRQDADDDARDAYATMTYDKAAATLEVLRRR